MRVLLLVIVYLSLFPSVRARADEVTLTGGKQLQGSLELDGKGRLRFVSPGQPTPPSLAGLDVRLTPAAPRSLRAATIHRITLPGSQQLTGELLGLNDKELKLRTGWSDPLSIPRQAVVAVTHPPGWVT